MIWHSKNILEKNLNILRQKENKVTLDISG